MADNLEPVKRTLSLGDETQKTGSNSSEARDLPPTNNFAKSVSDGFALLQFDTKPTSTTGAATSNVKSARASRALVRGDAKPDADVAPKKRRLRSDRNVEEPQRKKTTLAHSFFAAAATRTGSQSGKQPSFRESPGPKDDVDQETPMSWVEKYSPKTSKVTALHARKMKDVREVVEEMCSSNPRTKLLILSGPAGSSKSTIIKTLAKEILSRHSGTENDLSNNHLIEWENPDRMEGRNLLTAFSEFLASVRFKTNKDCLVLVDDLPNLSHFPTKQAFNDALFEWVNRPNVIPKNHNPGLVLVITEIELTSANDGSMAGSRNTDSMVTERLVNEKILKNCAVSRIKFRPVNKTLLTKTLKNIVASEKAIFQGLHTMEINNAISVFADFGDIRAAIMAMEFWAIGRSKSQSHKSSATNVEKDGEDMYLNMLRRDSHLDLFHAVGKVVFLSSSDKSGTTMENDAIVREIITDWASGRGDQQILSSTIFDNFLPLNTHLPFSGIMTGLESLCDSDILTTVTNYGYEGGVGGGQTTEIAGELDIRGVRLALERNLDSRVEKSGFNPMRYPPFLKRPSPEVTELKLKFEMFKENRMTQEQGFYGGMWSSESTVLYGKYFYDLIEQHKKYHPVPEPMVEQEPEVKENPIFEYHSSDFDTDFDDELEKEFDDMLSTRKESESQEQQTPQSTSVPQSKPMFLEVARKTASEVEVPDTEPPRVPASAQTSIYEDEDIDEIFKDL